MIDAADVITHVTETDHAPCQLCLVGPMHHMGVQAGHSNEEEDSEEEQAEEEEEQEERKRYQLRERRPIQQANLYQPSFGGQGTRQSFLSLIVVPLHGLIDHHSLSA